MKDMDTASPGNRKRFLRQVLRLAGPYWCCERRLKVRGMALALLVLTIAQVGISVWGNYWNRALFDALEQRSVRGLILQVAVFALILAVSIAVTAAHLLIKRWLQLDWRAWLTEKLVGRWLEDDRHYRLLSVPGEHDNPDQRIAEDIRIATESAIAMAHTLFFSLLSLGLFINILWSVSGAIVLPGTTVEVPGYLVPLAFLYAILGSGFGWLVGRPLVHATNALQTAEATFRFGLSRVRENGEAIALSRGEPMERSNSTARFHQVVHDYNRQSMAFLWLVSFSTAYGSLMPVFPILVAAPQYIAGTMTLGILMQAAQAFQRLASSLSWPVDNIGEIARCRASAERVLFLYQAMEAVDAQAQAPGGGRISVHRATEEVFRIDDLSMAEPTGEMLLERFSAVIRPGEKVLFTGNPLAAAGLFKVAAGLWPWGRGHVALPRSGMMFVPQRPFLPEGTLRAALCYPDPAEAFGVEDITRALDRAGLHWLIPRLEERSNWEQILTLHAQQRFGIARVLLKRPAWVFMDEATDAFKPEGERRILETVLEELPESTLLTISFHPGLDDLHHRTILLERPGEEGSAPAAQGSGSGSLH